MFLTKKLAASPAMVSMMTWLGASEEQPSRLGQPAKLKIDFVVRKTENGRWCWELFGSDGRVHGRSTPEFIRRDQAVCSAYLMQHMVEASRVVDHEGRSLHVS